MTIDVCGFHILAIYFFFLAAIVHEYWHYWIFTQQGKKVSVNLRARKLIYQNPACRPCHLSWWALNQDTSHNAEGLLQGWRVTERQTAVAAQGAYIPKTSVPEQALSTAALETSGRWQDARNSGAAYLGICVKLLQENCLFCFSGTLAKIQLSEAHITVMGPQCLSLMIELSSWTGNLDTKGENSFLLPGKHFWAFAMCQALYKSQGIQ